MGARGPKPKSAELQAMQGNPGKRAPKHEDPIEDVSFGSLRMPQRLTEDERKVWVEILEAMPAWYFKPADKLPLIAYCRASARMEKAAKVLENQPSVIERANGSKCQSPHLAIYNEALDQMLKLTEVLGLGRKARTMASLPTGADLPDATEAVGQAGGEPDDFGDLIPQGI